MPTIDYDEVIRIIRQVGEHWNIDGKIPIQYTVLLGIFLGKKEVAEEMEIAKKRYQ